MSDISERVKKILAENLSVDESRIIPNAKITDDLGGDSLILAEISFALEDEFKVEIPDEKTATLTTLDDVVKCIEEAIEVKATKEAGTAKTAEKTSSARTAQRG
ncbi:MAG: acyl carrier protein [Holosporaceae bacterium]